MAETVRNRVLELLQALAHENRLKILGLVAEQEHNVTEIASALDLREPTVSHHLSKLHAAGLVRLRRDGTTHFYALDVGALQELNRRLRTTEHIARLGTDVEGTLYEKRVLQSFLTGHTLSEIPASRKKRDVILRWLAEKFEPDRQYSEREVNAILRRHHDDTATLRRELVGCKLLQRARGSYWKPNAA